MIAIHRSKEGPIKPTKDGGGTKNKPELECGGGQHGNEGGIRGKEFGPGV